MPDIKVGDWFITVADEKDCADARKASIEYHRKVAAAKKYFCPYCHKQTCYVIDGKFECPNCEIYGFDPKKVFNKKRTTK